MKATYADVLDSRASEARLAWLGRPMPLSLVIAIVAVRTASRSIRDGKQVDAEASLRQLKDAERGR